MRLRGLPESVRNSILETTICELFNKILKKDATAPMLFERVHRVHRMTTPPADTVIVRFLDWGMKQVLQGLRSSAPIKYMGAEILVFTDLSQETPARRRELKPLIKQLQDKKIVYRWGFPACPTAENQGVAATLPFPEDLKGFCSKLELSLPQIENWGKKKTQNGRS